MRRLLLLCSLVPVGHAFAQGTGGPQAATSEGLYVLSVKKSPAENGKTLSVLFREIKREPESSVVEVEVSGEDRLAWGPILQGMCGLIHARLHESAVAEQTSVQPLRFRLTFPNNPKIDDRPGPPRLVFTAKDCLALNR